MSAVDAVRRSVSLQLKNWSSSECAFAAKDLTGAEALKDPPKVVGVLDPVSVANSPINYIVTGSALLAGDEVDHAVVLLESRLKDPARRKLVDIGEHINVHVALATFHDVSSPSTDDAARHFSKAVDLIKARLDLFQAMARKQEGKAACDSIHRYQLGAINFTNKLANAYVQSNESVDRANDYVDFLKSAASGEHPYFKDQRCPLPVAKVDSSLQLAFLDTAYHSVVLFEGQRKQPDVNRLREAVVGLRRILNELEDDYQDAGNASDRLRTKQFVRITDLHARLGEAVLSDLEGKD